MKNYGMMLALAAGVLLAASCEKANNDLPSGKVNMTLTASIANPETKTLYNDAGDGKLSVTWGGEETISVLIVNDDETIAKNCPLTYSGTSGLKEITFTGTVDALSSGQKYVCVYPALEKNGTDYKSSKGALRYHEGVLNYETTGTEDYVQGDFTPDNLKDADFLTGTPEAVSGGYNVVLTRHIGILKLVVTVPGEFKGKVLQGAGIITTGSEKPFATNLNMNLFTQTYSLKKDENAFIMLNLLNIPDSGQLILYIPMGPCVLPEYTYSIGVMGQINKMSAGIDTTGKGTVEIKAGYMTTITVDASSLLWNDLS